MYKLRYMYKLRVYVFATYVTMYVGRLFLLLSVREHGCMTSARAPRPVLYDLQDHGVCTNKHARTYTHTHTYTCTR